MNLTRAKARSLEDQSLVAGLKTRFPALPRTEVRGWHGSSL